MNKNAVSAVIGVILMVAITVAIAATVYVYVTKMSKKFEPTITPENTTGNLLNVKERGDLIGLYFDNNSICFEDVSDENWFVLTTYIGKNVTVSYEHHDYPKKDNYNKFIGVVECQKE